MGKITNDSRDTVYRYIHLTNLIPEILDLMDEGKIAFTVGEALSYLDEDVQYSVLAECEVNDCTPSYAQAVEMKKLFQSGELTNEAIENIMNREKPNQRETIKIPTEKLKGKIPNSFTKDQAEDFVIKAVEYYHRHLMRQRENLR